MPVIRCTRKLLAELTARVSKTGAPAQSARLGDWYANLLRVGRRECVVFASERTLLTFLSAGLTRDAIRDFASLFRAGLRTLLEHEGVSPDVIEPVLDEYREVALAHTTDRSVLGSLNDLARMAAALIQEAGGLGDCDLAAVNRRLNRTPMGRLQMASPVEATRRVLEGGDVAARENRPPEPRRKRPPGRLAPGTVRLERQGDAAILVPNDPGMAVPHLRLGPRLARVSDEEVLDCFKETIAAQERLAEERPYVAVEVPPGRPQIRFFPDSGQWAPRGGVVRCIVDTDEDGQAIVYVDERKLTLAEFGRMVATYAGWGMRIEFTPEDEAERRPRLEVREPDEA